MTRRTPAAISALISCVARFNEALAGDLTEEWSSGHSKMWLCLEIIVALTAHMLASARSRARLTTESTVVDIAAVGGLSVWVVFTANVIARVLDGGRGRPAALWHDQGLGLASGVMSFAGALVVGTVVHGLREQHRLLATFSFGVSLMLNALLTVYLVPTVPLDVFFPSPVHQTVVTAVFILGLSIGSAIASRLRHV